MFLENLKNSTALFLHRYLFMSANAATLLGFLFAFGAGFLIFQGSFFYAALFLLISGFLDLMDGAIARQSGKVSPFGGILDSTLDRYGDFFVLGGIILYSFNERFLILSALALISMIGFFSVSYVRARAECVISSCRVGFWERGERLVYLMVGLVWNNLPMTLLVLAVGTNFTAFYRLYWASRSDKSTKAQVSIFNQNYGRLHPYYWVKVAFLLGLLFFARPSF